MNNRELNNFRRYFYKEMGQFIEEKGKITLEDINSIMEKCVSTTIIDSETSNKIMVCMGSFKDSVDKFATKEILTYEENHDASYKKYIDLETSELYTVPIDKVGQFESEYHIEYLPINLYNIQEYNNKLNELRLKFFKNLLYNSQEDTVLKLKMNGLN